MDLSFAHPLWLWWALGGALLIGELSTGSSWLLWPAVCAGLMGVLAAFGVPAGLPAQLAVYAGLCLVTTFGGRALFRRRAVLEGPDVNDASERLLGRPGRALGVFHGGQGRVLVDGHEWLAEVAGGGPLDPGAPVTVIERLDGARLKVLPAPDALSP